MVETEFFVQRHPSKRRGKEDHPRSTESKLLKMWSLYGELAGSTCSTMVGIEVCLVGIYWSVQFW